MPMNSVRHDFPIVITYAAGQGGLTLPSPLISKLVSQLCEGFNDPKKTSQPSPTLPSLAVCGGILAPASKVQSSHCWLDRFP